MTRQPSRTILATWFAMLTVQSIGSIDGKHKLPAPKQYVLISVLWGTLFLMAETGAAKLAARLSLLILLTASVVGPFGVKFIQFLDTIARRFGLASQAQTQAVPPGTAQPAQTAKPA